MQEVAIIGAGELGGAVGTRSRGATSVRPSADRREGPRGRRQGARHRQAAPIEGFATQLRDRPTSRPPPGHASSFWPTAWAAASGRVRRDCAGEAAVARRRTRVIVCAGVLQRDLVGRGVRELHVAGARLSARRPRRWPAAPAARGARRQRIAARRRRCRCSACRRLNVIPGRRNARRLALRGSSTSGAAAPQRPVDACGLPGRTRSLSGDTGRRSDGGRSRRIVSCFVAPDTSSGTQTRTAALPVRLGPAGIVDDRAAVVDRGREGRAG